MKNKTTVSLALAPLLAVVLGCGFVERAENIIGGAAETNVNAASNKSLTDTAIETAVGGEKIGVPECDDLLERVAELAASPDDNYVAKATRQFVLSKIRENIKRSIEQNKNDKTQLAKDCQEYRRQFDRYKNQEAANKQ